MPRSRVIAAGLLMAALVIGVAVPGGADYLATAKSRQFSFLTGKELTRFVNLREKLDDTAVEVQFEQRMREHLPEK